MDMGGNGKFFTIRSNLNGLVLDIQDNMANPGNPVKTWNFNGGDNQLWFQDFGKCCIRSKLDENYCLEIMGKKVVDPQFTYLLKPQTCKT